MCKSIRGNEIMCIFKRRITQLFFLIPILMLALLVVPVSYAEKLNANFAKASYGPVTGSDTLGKIVSRNYSGSTLSSQQIMTGILRANPEAFIGGNIHFLLRGSTLLLPKEKLIKTIDQNEAEKIIKKHLRYFQRGKTGNFKIAPLVYSNADSDLARDAASILSGQADRIEINTSAEESKLSPATTKSVESDLIVKKEPSETEQKTTANISQSQTAIAGESNSSVKDIELESLKIKISRLEKILSSRGLPSDVSEDASKKIKNTLEAQKEKIDLLEQDKKNKNNELEQLKEKITELESSLKKMSQSLSEKESLALSSGDDKDKLINQLKVENTDLEKKIDSLQVELTNKIEEVAALATEIKQSKKTIGELENKLLNSDSESFKLDQKIAEMEEKLAKIRQEPARNMSINGASDSALGFGKSPWVWLLPALFLLSILAYLFKRSFSQPKKALVTDSKATEQYKQKHKEQQDTEKVVIKDQELSKKKTSDATPSIVPDIISSASEEESMEASIKLDIAKAYIDMEMPDAAIEILQEAYEEGSNKQRLEAKNLLEKLS